MSLGLPYIAFDVPKGAAEKIGSFYRKIMGIPAEIDKHRNLSRAKVLVGKEQYLYFNEVDGAIAAYDGHHIQLYIVKFSGPHRNLNDAASFPRKAISTGTAQEKIVDPDSGELAYELEHEIRSVTHPLSRASARQSQSCADEPPYHPGHDALAWTVGHDA